MADLARNNESENFYNNKALQAKHLQILINEKVNQIKAWTLTLEKMKTVEMQRIELTIEKLQIEIEQLKEALNKLQINDATIIDQGE